MRTTFGGYVRTVLAKYGVAISLWKDGRCLGEGLAVVRPVLDREWQWVAGEESICWQAALRRREEDAA